jgi:hypothetical protein
LSRRPGLIAWLRRSTFEIRRSGRRKTLGLTVDRHGELLVHAPEGEPTTRIETWVRSKLLWVHRRLAAKERLASAWREPEFVTGESFSVLGRRYPLRIDPTQEAPLRFDGRKFCLSPQVIPSAARHFRAWYAGIGRVWVREIVLSPGRAPLACFGALPHAGAAFIAGTVIFSFGELVFSSALPAAVARLAPPGRRGAYQGAWTLLGSASMGSALFVSGLLREATGWGAAWMIYAGVTSAAGMLLLLTRERFRAFQETRQDPRLPAR